MSAPAPKPTTVRVGSLIPDVSEALLARGWGVDDLLSCEKAFDEYCNWRGLPDWGPTLRTALRDIDRKSKREGGGS